MKKIIVTIAAFLLSSSIAQAAITQLVPSAGANVTLGTTAGILIYYLNLATQLLLALAIVFVLWNTVKFIMSGGEAEKRDEARSGIIYGLIGIAVMVSLWGLVTFIATSAGMSTGGTSVAAPTV